MYGDRDGDRKENVWGVGKAKHDRNGVTRQTQQTVTIGTPTQYCRLPQLL